MKLQFRQESGTKSYFWDNQCQQSFLLCSLYGSADPIERPADSITEEILRLASRLHHDIYSNDLHHDTLRTLEFILEQSQYFSRYLKDEKSLGLIRLLEEKILENSDETEYILIDQDFCDTLDDVLIAIINYSRR